MIRIALTAFSLVLVLGSFGCAAESVSDPTSKQDDEITSTSSTNETTEQDKVGVSVAIDRNPLAEKPKVPGMFEESRLKEMRPLVEKKP